jgi:predicted cupin superfamily sugar epimerase
MSADADIAALIAALDLSPHAEGGFFCETYRSAGRVGDRALSTAIYFLVTAASPSRMHRVSSDEIWHFYAGDPLEMLQLDPDGSSCTIAMGNDVIGGERPQVLVASNVWQGVRVREGGRYGLVGATVTPGFDFDDFEMGDRAPLVAAYSERRSLIEALT